MSSQRVDYDSETLKLTMIVQNRDYLLILDSRVNYKNAIVPISCIISLKITVGIGVEPPRRL